MRDSRSLRVGETWPRPGPRRVARAGLRRVRVRSRDSRPGPARCALCRFFVVSSFLQHNRPNRFRLLLDLNDPDSQTVMPLRSGEVLLDRRWISLQGESHPAEFKSVEIKPLPAAAPGRASRRRRLSRPDERRRYVDRPVSPRAICLLAISRSMIRT